MARFFREYVLQVLVGVSAVASVTVWALIDKYWNWPTAIVGALLLTCSVVYLMDRLGLGPSLRSRVRDWLDSSGYGIQTVGDANYLHFRMTDNIGMITDILQVKSGAPIIIASGHHTATQSQLAAFNEMPPAQQRAYWQHVRIELLRYGISFSDLSLDGDGVMFSETLVPSRGLTGIELLRRVMFVRSGARLYWELLLKLDRGTESQSSRTASGPAIGVKQ